MTRTRYVIASFIAPVAALLLPTILALSQLFTEVEILPDGSVDDAPMRGAGLFLVIGLPLCYLVACLYYAAVGHLLSRWRRLTLRSTVSLAAAVPWLLFAIGAVGIISNNRDYAPGLIILGVICMLTSLSAVLGAVAWWLIAVGRVSSNGAAQGGRPTAAPGL
jgi:NADH:ubiquinone oxidoreductase subunit K